MVRVALRGIFVFAVGIVQVSVPRIAGAVSGTGEPLKVMVRGSRKENR